MNAAQSALAVSDVADLYASYLEVVARVVANSTVETSSEETTKGSNFIRRGTLFYGLWMCYTRIDQDRAVSGRNDRDGSTAVAEGGGLFP